MAKIFHQSPEILKRDFANPDAGKGADLVGVKSDGAGAVGRILKDKIFDRHSAKDFGAIRDGSDQTTEVQAAVDFVRGDETLGGAPTYGGKDGGFIDIPQGVQWTPVGFNFRPNVTILQDTGTSIEYYLNGENVSGAVNEFVVKSGFHPAYILDVHDDYTIDTLGAGQVLGWRSSFIYRINGASNWQIAQDIDNVKDKHLTWYALNPSLQVMNMHHNGRIRFGRRTSIQDFSNPPDVFTFHNNLLIEKDEGEVVTIQLKTVTAGVTDATATTVHRKLIQLNTDGSLTILDDVATAYILRLQDDGRLRTTKGISGGAFSTVARNALTGWAAGDIGTMIFDSTLGKPIWLKTTAPTWVDATGTTV